MISLCFTLLLSIAPHHPPLPSPSTVNKVQATTLAGAANAAGSSSSGGSNVANITLASALLTLSGGIVAAVLGSVFKYFYDLRIARRKDRLDRVNLQLRLLYGPLYATDLAAREAWLAFRRKCRPNVDSFWHDSPPPTSQEAAEWRVWTTDVFMPLNERMERTIVENADLLPGSTIPVALLTMCAHVAAYKAIRKKWSAGNFSEHNSPIQYPWQEFRAHVTSTFQELKEEQAVLLSRNGER
jgi:hypothetical protein